MVIRQEKSVLAHGKNISRVAVAREVFVEGLLTMVHMKSRLRGTSPFWLASPIARTVLKRTLTCSVEISVSRETHYKLLISAGDY
jgi:hypothetical protein